MHRDLKLSNILLDNDMRTVDTQRTQLTDRKLQILG